MHVVENSKGSLLALGPDLVDVGHGVGKLLGSRVEGGRRGDGGLGPRSLGLPAHCLGPLHDGRVAARAAAVLVEAALGAAVQRVHLHLLPDQSPCQPKHWDMHFCTDMPPTKRYMHCIAILQFKHISAHLLSYTSQKLGGP